VLKRLPALWPWLIHHWFLLANSLFWLVAGLEAFATANVLRWQVYQLPAFVFLRVVPAWLFCAWLHRAVQRQPAWRNLQGWRRVALVIALLSGFALAISLLLHGARFAIGDPDPGMTHAKFWVYVLVLELRLMVWAGFYLLIAGSRDLLVMQARSAELELAVTRAQLSLLSAAFQPHFLMNAMNTLIACRHDPDAVEAAGEGLAGYLRYALDRGSSELEPLAVQLEALSNYITVEELRFGNRLQCRINVDPQLLSVPVPRFLLQPLVENALKFGQAGSSAPLQLQIELQRCGDQLQLQVINSGRMGEPAVAASRGVGYGLDSLRQRLELHYGSRAGFVLHQDGTRVLATVQLPLR
jgi:hypothetical protein